MVDFSKLKKNSALKTEKLLESLKVEAQSNSNTDARFWKPVLDAEKNAGGAVIRFLSQKDDEVLDYVKFILFSFQNSANKKWYIERCLNDIGPKGIDPLANFNARLWATQIKENQAICSKQKQNKKYISNILVINDPAKPENNGKVFLYQFGTAVFNFIEKVLDPKPHPITGKIAPIMNPFDMWHGANFNLLINKTEHGWNYDQSGFDAPESLDKSDAVLESIFNQTYSLEEFSDVKNYKTVDELKKRLIEVLGVTYRGLEVVEGYGNQFPTSTTQQEASAPQQQEAKAKQSVEDIKPTFEKSSDADLFNELMEDDIPFN